MALMNEGDGNSILSPYFDFVRSIVALSKPGVTILNVLATVVGLILANGVATFNVTILIIVGTTLVVASAGASNMIYERESDAKMKRTSKRPLPAGKLSLQTAYIYTVLSGGIGLVLLYRVSIWSALFGFIGWILYVGVYTPMKSKTPLSLYTGAIAGAMTPLIGYSALSNLDGVAYWLVALLFFWQLPHVLAIAIFREEDYHRAGIQFYSGLKARNLLIITLLLFAVTPWFLPLIHQVGLTYLISMPFLSVMIGWSLPALIRNRENLEESTKISRQIFFQTLLHLPVVFCVLVVDFWA
ncbi:MAG: protoheme IX farnesyltransferase [Leptonema sp. (in: Bacteria)]|nr:protoheme IX farnesyltransferase [Leptonema sp. (in: bacteria)]